MHQQFDVTDAAQKRRTTRLGRSGFRGTRTPSSRQKPSARLRTAAISACVTAIVGLTGAEAYLRLTREYITPETERQAALEYEASLFSRHVLPQVVQVTGHAGDREGARINSLGYRGQPFTIAKPQGVRRVVVLGGSAAFDIGAPRGRDWPHLVERKLHRAGHSKVEVINAATPGHATWDLLGRLYAEIWMLKPDYIVVYEAWNDIKYFTWLDPRRSLLRGYRPVPTVEEGDLRVANPFIYYHGWADKLLSHSQFYVRLRRRYWWWRLGMVGPEGLLTGPDQATNTDHSYPDSFGEWGPRQYELNLRLIADAALDIGATPVLVTQARLVSATNGSENKARIRYDYVGLSHAGLLRAFAECDAALLRAARLEGVPALDLSGKLSGRAELFLDHVHTTQTGSEAVAEAVANLVGFLMSQRNY